jgi:hypothetical protein
MKRQFMSKPKTTAQNLESRFEAGEDVLDYFDPAKAVPRGWPRKASTVVPQSGTMVDRGEGQKNGGTSNIEH